MNQESIQRMLAVASLAMICSLAQAGGAFVNKGSNTYEDNFEIPFNCDSGYFDNVSVSATVRGTFLSVIAEDGSIKVHNEFTFYGTGLGLVTGQPYIYSGRALQNENYDADFVPEVFRVKDAFNLISTSGAPDVLVHFVFEYTVAATGDAKIVRIGYIKAECLE